MSAPHMHAVCLDALAPALQENGGRALDVGSGTGYLTAVLGVMVGPQGTSYGVEHVPALVQYAKDRMERAPETKEMMRMGQVVFVQGDGRHGLRDHAPFDIIHVGAAAPMVPDHLKDQLKVGGRLIIPVGISEQWVLQIDRISQTEFTERKLMGVRYVPLTDLDRQLSDYL
eukprot:CAMPEP_0196592992 /NCGR_PEP_ID=MMETSP1081-20130531/74348_1 /TAXON_ID=36882 /ORGANISM="Pyramimonas amylifera, Strain CCMP720" /LENGTH=170 /DNA_ID=CAMNT_0041916827 /DNA_START=442 /DNA_END=954 /DNA_ORIENTATION=+